jgi:type 1 fimbriae regulatory protein FimB
MLERVGERAGIKVHPHMLRHACGYELINRGKDLRTIQAWLGHKNVQNTTIYTALNSAAFRHIWD